MKDLSKDIYSSTAVLIELLPKIEKLKKDSCSDLEKRKKAHDMIEEAFNNANDRFKLEKSKNSSFNTGISPDRIVFMRMKVLKSKNFNEAIKYLKNSIENGKHYNGGNNK